MDRYSPMPGHEDIPTYEESVQQGAQSIGGADAKIPVQSGRGENPGSLNQQLADVRTQRINAIMTDYIDPLLSAQASTGLYKTTIVLVPSNTSSLTVSHDIMEGPGDAIAAGNETVIGFPHEEYVKLVRLHGEDFTYKFWRQPAVIAELESSLRARLHATGHRLAEAKPKIDPVIDTPPPLVPSQAQKRGFFRRKPSQDSSASSTPALPIRRPTAGGSWQLAEEEMVEPGHIKATVGIQEICLRVTSEMGLYETRRGSAVVVKMHIGS